MTWLTTSTQFRRSSVLRKQSVDDAIRQAVERASKTLRNLDWFEVSEIRGHIDDERVCHFQVTLKVGFRLEEPS